MKRLLIGVSIFWLFSAVTVYASSLPPQGVCRVKLKVLKVSERTVRVQLAEHEFENDNLVSLSVEIQDILGAADKASAEDVTCGGGYKAKDIITLSVIRRPGVFMDPQLPIQVGDVILGNLERIGGWPGGSDQPVNSYELTNIRSN